MRSVCALLASVLSPRLSCRCGVLGFCFAIADLLKKLECRCFGSTPYRVP
ncbi:hypothetical protein KC19_VG005500 [Ceratodon purpureus]|uniref:Uncharacterized protein n=1 Tax=Ceratodon purpureus TaxID=3225 RepID=A0A8T0HKT0_CERPU|nr:hypothetical protein KC19_VG005500 [Ceratodon purpureus]